MEDDLIIPAARDELSVGIGRSVGGEVCNVAVQQLVAVLDGVAADFLGGRFAFAENAAQIVPIAEIYIPGREHAQRDEQRAAPKLRCALLIALCALGGSLCSSKGISEYIEIAGCCGAAMIMLKGVDGIVSQTVESMFRLSDYSKAALPVIFTAAAAGGALTSAGAKFAAVSLALDVLMSIAQKLVVPLVYAYLAVTVANGVFPNSLMAAAARFTKWAATIIMTGMTISFTAYIGMTGVITSSTDAAAVKTMRTVISTVLPVVGGMISDASGAVLAAAGVIRSCAGAFGLITVCILCAGPFAVLSVKMLILKAAAAVTDSMQSPRLSALFSGVGSAMGLLLGLLGCCGIMLFISMMAGMKAVTG